VADAKGVGVLAAARVGARRSEATVVMGSRELRVENAIERKGEPGSRRSVVAVRRS
jgi:hypothetical protein